MTGLLDHSGDVREDGIVGLRFFFSFVHLLRLVVCGVASGGETAFALS